MKTHCAQSTKNALTRMLPWKIFLTIGVLSVVAVMCFLVGKLVIDDRRVEIKNTFKNKAMEAALVKSGAYAFLIGNWRRVDNVESLGSPYQVGIKIFYENIDCSDLGEIKITNVHIVNSSTNRTLCRLDSSSADRIKNTNKEKGKRNILFMWEGISLDEYSSEDKKIIIQFDIKTDLKEYKNIKQEFEFIRKEEKGSFFIEKLMSV